MASTEGDDVVDVTMEDQEEQEDEQEENEEQEEGQEDQEQEQEEQEEQEEAAEERKEQESEDEIEFLGSVEGSNAHESEDEAEVVVVEQQQRSRANANALMAANGLVTSATLEAEFQCIICQYALFKPVTVFCGHSFCRVCLMDSFLTRSMEEAQCPICRVEILQPLAPTSSPSDIFNINVILWNAIQLLVPTVAARISSYQQEEEKEYARKLDQLDAKWKIFFLTERAGRYHGDHGHGSEDIEFSSRSVHTGDEASRWEEEHDEHPEYPVLKVEDSEDGNLHISRNVVLDTSDANEDGIMNMRIGFAIVEFPSVFELYNEHQECSLNVIKMEEDEEMADGMPFFMSENGEDDALVCNSYYNNITLRVCDDGGNCVMERSRGARSGVVDFPGLRLDVPGGMYTFRFSDDLYGLKLSIAMQLRELHETSDAPVSDYISLVTDEARDARRRNRGRNSGHSDDEGDYDEDGNDSEDSFIVDDLGGEEPIGHFSDDEGENRYGYHSDDEEADEQRERRRRRRRRRSAGRSDRDVEIVEEQVDEGEFSGDGADHEENEGDGTGEHDEDEEEDNGDEEFGQQGRRNVQLVEEDNDDEEDHQESHEISRSRRRNANHILDSEDEDEVGGSGSDENAEHDSVVQEENGEADSDNKADADSDADADIDIDIDIDVEDEGDDAADENEDETASSDVPDRKVKRDQWEEDGSDAEDNLAQQDDNEGRSEVAERRPLKRPRDRNVQIVDEGESDEETEEMERAIITANSLNGGADQDVEDNEDTGEHPFYEDENDEVHLDEDDVGEDYPDEDEGEDDRYQEEEDAYTGEFSD
ncbi:hypothetical protein PHYBOEH_000469 [Phytophthora boehmeriae]|uniref:RING-type domain-containing protein n=1 Tax=Phytophthora boehmeriae TaxID=109152 RepID=A0A8T1X0L1_9STRA|nr:hypothetical protein PHYBOEH_000469 [Phytophthora boehmeriae]